MIVDAAGGANCAPTPTWTPALAPFTAGLDPVLGMAATRPEQPGLAIRRLAAFASPQPVGEKVAPA